MHDHRFRRDNFKEYQEHGQGMHDHRFHRGKFKGNFKEYQEHRRKNRMFFGIAIAIVGIALMLRTLGVLPYFSLEFSWPFILIIFGLFIGIKSGFRNFGWLVFVLIGLANITPQFMIGNHPSRDFAWPAMIIIVGLAIALRPRRKDCLPRRRMDSSVNDTDSLNIDVTFGGKKEIVTSKDFKGGIVTVAFAGCEINLTQADFAEQSIIIDFRVSFGGIELIVPANWEVQNELSSSFGSVEDERTIQVTSGTEPKKTLILRGSCSFGSIEIKSY